LTEHAVNREVKPAATESPWTYTEVPAPTTANPRYSLCSAVARHARFEKASFHTPGHKGRQEYLFENDYLSAAGDLTELPGLDDLSAPSGVIADIEQRAAILWGSVHSFVSVNGASAALAAAILAAAAGYGHESRKYALVPRNAHRSVIHALCLAAVEPIWYEPNFEQDWGIWGAATVPPLQAALENSLAQALPLVCALVVSPTYGGALSDIRAISRLTKAHAIPLIVDEAHGAHFLPKGSSDCPATAIACGADAVAHSWHKTLPALTQTGMLHLPKGSKLNPSSVRSCLNLITSSSPNYLLLASMEKTLALLESDNGNALVQKLATLSTRFRQGLSVLKSVSVYDTDSGINPSHLLISTSQEQIQGHNLYEFLQDRGIFAEAAMGTGVLFMLGLGSEEGDVDLALATIQDFVSAYELNEQGDNFVASVKNSVGNAHAFAKRQPSFEPSLPPHQAMSMPHETVSVGEALGRIAAQCLAPCPPGIPILIPGQKITEEVLELVSDKVLVVVAK